MDVVVRIMQGFKEWKAHNVVPVGVGENKMVLQVTFTIQLIAATTNARTGINQDEISTLGPDFKAGGIAPVFQIRFTGNRY